MGNMSWIKLSTDLFDNSKIKLIRRQKKGTEMVLLWVYLLTLAGKCDFSGELRLSKDMPYDVQLLSDETELPCSLIEQALELFGKMNMVEQEKGVYRIASWREHQNVERLETIREQTRKRVANYRKKQAAEALGNESNAECNVTVTPPVTQQRREEENKEEKNREEKSNAEQVPSENLRVLAEVELKSKEIMDIYNRYCWELGRVEQFTREERRSVEHLVRRFSMEDITTMFRKASESPFLKGGGGNGWRATFHWLIQPDNVIKVLRGAYDPPQKTTREKELEEYERRAFESLNHCTLE